MTWAGGTRRVVEADGESNCSSHYVTCLRYHQQTAYGFWFVSMDKAFGDRWEFF